mmetsp:Transcript_18582/g.32939  ORF Transcript_18582/g.32939 Transcript_18582/m.32939 type:complete len:290 (-) Transcript_18582:138-1007(-)
MALTHKIFFTCVCVRERERAVTLRILNLNTDREEGAANFWHKLVKAGGETRVQSVVTNDAAVRGKELYTACARGFSGTVVRGWEALSVGVHFDSASSILASLTLNEVDVLLYGSILNLLDKVCVGLASNHLDLGLIELDEALDNEVAKHILVLGLIPSGAFERFYSLSLALLEEVFAYFHFTYAELCLSAGDANALLHRNQLLLLLNLGLDLILGSVHHHRALKVGVRLGLQPNLVYLFFCLLFNEGAHLCHLPIFSRHLAVTLLVQLALYHSPRAKHKTHDHSPTQRP